MTADEHGDTGGEQSAEEHPPPMPISRLKMPTPRLKRPGTNDVAADHGEAEASEDSPETAPHRSPQMSKPMWFPRLSRSRNRRRRCKRRSLSSDNDRGMVEEVQSSRLDDHEVESVGAEDALEEVRNRRKPVRRHYKIQEVIKRRQILLVQVVKEERGNKGAALTTYLSLAGRYSVLMPNTARGGGISRKITNAQDRKRLKEVVADLEVPQGMGVILRTAGESRTKAEIKRDYEYLMRLWENVRNLTLQSTAPALVYEEGSLIKRSVRDLYNKDIDEILVSGEEGYREAKDFMRMLMPSHAKVVQPYRDTTPIFVRYGIEAQLDRMLQPQVTLKIRRLHHHQPDRGAGRHRRQFGPLDQGALDRGDRAPHQPRSGRGSRPPARLRDLAGLIVIDFIDMEENRNNRSVEKRLKDHLKNDRARIQVGRISHFGLMEMSRQRIRASVLELTMKPCPHCGGTGHVRSESSVALLVVRAIEEFLLKDSRSHITVQDPGGDGALRAQPQARHAGRTRGPVRPDHHDRGGRSGRRAALCDLPRRNRGKARWFRRGAQPADLCRAGRARRRDRRRGRRTRRLPRRSSRASPSSNSRRSARTAKAATASGASAAGGVAARIAIANMATREHGAPRKVPWSRRRSDADAAVATDEADRRGRRSGVSTPSQWTHRTTVRRKKRRRGKRGGKRNRREDGEDGAEGAADGVEADAPESEAVAIEPVAETVAAVSAEELPSAANDDMPSAEKPKKKRASRSKKAAAEVAAETVAEEPPRMLHRPRRRRLRPYRPPRLPRRKRLPMHARPGASPSPSMLQLYRWFRRPCPKRPRPRKNRSAPASRNTSDTSSRNTTMYWRKSVVAAGIPRTMQGRGSGSV